jgi:hypothetical protein
LGLGCSSLAIYRGRFRRKSVVGTAPDGLGSLPPAIAAKTRSARAELEAEAKDKEEAADRLGIKKEDLVLPPLPAQAPRGITPSDAPFGVSKALAAAVLHAERYHVQF